MKIEKEVPGRKHRAFWACEMCGAAATAPTIRMAKKQLREHQLAHIEQWLEEMAADGLIKAIGVRNGRTVYVGVKQPDGGQSLVNAKNRWVH